MKDLGRERRWQIRRAKEVLDRELRGLERERRRLRRATWEAPLIELEKPYQRGWIRFFALTARGKRRPDAAKLHEALQFVQRVQFSRSRDFCHYSGKSKRRVPLGHPLETLSMREILRRGVPDRVLKRLILRNRGPLRSKDEVRVLVQQGFGGVAHFRYPELCESVVAPYFITHGRCVLPEVESRLAEIEGCLRNGGVFRLLTLSGRKRWWTRLDRQGRDRRRDRLIARETRAFLEEEPEEPIGIVTGADDSAPFLFLWLFSFRWGASLRHARA
jgi:hypothetical protein